MSNPVSVEPGPPPAPEPKIIFLSYRRADASSASGRLYDALKQRYGATTVFLDVEDIRPSENFVREIHEALARTAVLVVVIGPDWRREPHPQGTDYVIEEVSTALRDGIPIVPVLVEGGRMPDAADLPEEVRELAAINALPIHHTSWDEGFRELAAVIEDESGISPASEETGLVAVAGTVGVAERAKAPGKGKRGCSVQVSIVVALAAMVLIIPIAMQPEMSGRRSPGPEGPDIGIEKGGPLDPPWDGQGATIDTATFDTAATFDTTAAADTVEADTASAADEP